MDRPTDEPRNTARPGRLCRTAAWALARRPLPWLILLAVLLHLRYPPTGLRLDYFGDQKRFFHEAESLATGRGYPTTSHAPGYPLLLAAVLRTTHSTDTSCERFVVATRWLQVLLAVAACVLAYAAVAPRSRRWAIVAFLLLAVFPGMHRAAWWPLSETLSVFLASVAACLLSVLFRECEPCGIALPPAAIVRRQLARACAALASAVGLGATCAAMVLTAPGMVCAAIPIGCLAAWRLRQSPVRLALLLAGGLLLVVPWQIHCWRAEGRIVWTFYTLPKPSPEFLRWYGTWARSEGDLAAFWNRGSLDTVPDDVFESSQERRELAAAWRAAFGRAQPSPEAEALFGRAADRRIAADPWSYYVRLPIARARRLWFQRVDMTAAEWAAFRAVTLATLLVAAAGTLRGRRGGRAVALAMLAATLLYTALSAGWPGLGESRRNLPFYPLLLSTLAFGPTRRDEPATTPARSASEEESR